MEGYQAAVSRVLSEPERIVLRVDSRGQLQMGLVRGDEQNWIVAIVDIDQRVRGLYPRLRTCFGTDPKRPYSWARRMERFAEKGWVEVRP